MAISAVEARKSLVDRNLNGAPQMIETATVEARKSLADRNWIAVNFAGASKCRGS